MGGQALGERIDARGKLARRHQRVEEADAQQLLGIDLFRREEQPLGGAEAEPRHITAQAAGVIMHADVACRHHQLDPGHADAEIAGEREVSAAAVEAAADRRDRRHAQRLELINHAVEAGRARVVAFGREFLEVEAGAEGAPGRGQHQHADAPVLLDAIEVPAQRSDVVGLDAVVVARPVEPDGGAGAVDGENGRARRLAGRWAGHGRYPA